MSRFTERPFSATFAISAVAVGLALLWRFDPAKAHVFPPCLFRAMTGFLCPGCGATRAVHHLLHGDVGGALRLNALLFAVPPFVIASRSQRFITSRAVGWTALAVVLAWWIVRNTPFWPWPA